MELVKWVRQAVLNKLSLMDRKKISNKKIMKSVKKIVATKRGSTIHYNIVENQECESKAINPSPPIYAPNNSGLAVIISS